MARILRFSRDRHSEAQKLLPWYVTGQLQSEDLALVEAHLRDCAECRADVAAERRLHRAVAAAPVAADAAWERLRRRLPAQGGRSRMGPALAAARTFLSRPGGLALAGAAGAAAAAVVVISFAPPPRAPAEYHALGAPAAARSGDALLMFQPQARAEDIADLLRASGARLVDGPTTTDAYVVQLPAGRRDAALAQLRRDPSVVMAEPLAEREAR